MTNMTDKTDKKGIDIIIAGVGGQGTVLLSRLIGSAALAAGYSVRGAETIGMAQRGGSVLSHVRLGEGAASPLIPQGRAALLLAMEIGEGVRALPYLKEGGSAVVLERAIRPVTSSLKDDGYGAEPMADHLRAHVPGLILVGSGDLAERGVPSRAMNVALLGVAAGAGLLPFGPKEAERAVRERVPARYLEMNELALSAGAEIGRAKGRK